MFYIAIYVLLRTGGVPILAEFIKIQNCCRYECLINILAKGPKYREQRPINWNYNFKILMDAVDDYARKWIKREKSSVKKQMEWIKAVRSLILIRAHVLMRSMNANASTRDPMFLDVPASTIFKKPRCSKNNVHYP